MGLFTHLLLQANSSMFLPLLCVAVCVTYGIGLVVYRWFLSPISHFPGPRLAAMTFWYEFYYDVILGGQYTFHIMEMHKHYGPVVRINPCELHFYTPQFYEEIYAGPTRRRDRWEYYTKGFGMPGAGASTNPHDLHRARRAALNPFFSMQSVRNLQGVIEGKVDILMKRLKGFGELASRGDKKPVNLELAFAAYAYGTCTGRSLLKVAG